MKPVVELFSCRVKIAETTDSANHQKQESLNNLRIRKATLPDIDFLCEAIINAEKSGTDILPLCRIFEITETELRTLLQNILTSDTEGCELSLSSFLIAELDGNKASAAAGWMEGENELHLPSSLIKANLLNYFLPPDKIKTAGRNISMIGDVLIGRTPGTFQIEYVYVNPGYRGKKLAELTIKEHLKAVKPGFKAEVQVFGNNAAAKRSYEKAGFSVGSVHESKNPATTHFLPGNFKIRMTKII